MEEKTLIRIRAYLQSIKSKFIDWSIRLVSEDWIIKITYKDHFIDFTIKEKIKWNDKEAYNQVVWFCFNCFYDYERDWKEMNSEELWRLLSLDPSAVRQRLFKIVNKLGVYGEQVLSKE